MDGKPEQTPESAEMYYRKIMGYANNEYRTGFKDWMVDIAVKEYLDNYFSDLFPYDERVEEVQDEG